MLLEELQKLVAAGESENLEFKKTTGQRTEAAKTVCALLNGLGGFLLFGVSDRGEIAGQQVTAKTLEDISLELRRIEPPAFPEIETVSIGDDKAVIVIRVSGKMGTYCYDGRPYLRHGPTTQIMPRSEYEKSERLFASYPQLAIRLARFRGTDRLGGFMDNRNYWGNGFDLSRRGESFLLDHVPISGRVVPGKRIREDYPLYPPLATREALANAICHRDYTTPGGAVAIAMYDDHLEIVNPGILHFDMTPEKLTKPHESKPWNPIIASVFYRAGVIEKWGMGTLNIIDWCKENGNPKPTWEVRAESVVTTFLPSGFFATGEMPEERPKLRPKSIEEEVVSLLRKGPLSKAEIAELLGHQHISGGLKKVFQSLIDQSVIAYTIPDKPRSKVQKYKLNE